MIGPVLSVGGLSMLRHLSNRIISTHAFVAIGWTMQNGIDRKALVTALKASDPSDRRRLSRSYRDWVFRGAKEQGWYVAGGPLLAGGAFAAFLSLFYGIGAIWLYFVCGFATLVGVVLLGFGARKERDWRRANPFLEWQGTD